MRKRISRKVHPFQVQCGLPARVESSEPLRRSVAERLAMRRCRGGIGDERNLGKPPLRGKIKVAKK